MVLAIWRASRIGCSGSIDRCMVLRGPRLAGVAQVARARCIMLFNISTNIVMISLNSFLAVKVYCSTRHYVEHLCQLLL